MLATLPMCKHPVNTRRLFHSETWGWTIPPMDKYERRRLRLLRLRDEQCGGSGAALARRIGRDQSYVTRMLYPETKKGKKRIADDMMEIVEEAFDLPRGWMDMDDAVSEPGDLPSNVTRMADQEDQRIAAVVALMLATDETGREVALGAVRVALSGYAGMSRQANGAR